MTNVLRILAACGAVLSTIATADAQSTDWAKVDGILGRTGAVGGQVHRYGFPRTDLQVTLDGVKRVHSLSKGYKRRLIVALGLLTRHPILLMDEPFDGFDLRQARDIMGVLRRAASAGRTLLLSIHQLRDAEQVCDRFALLADGRIRGLGTLDELRDRVSRPAANLEDIFLALT